MASHGAPVSSRPALRETLAFVPIPLAWMAIFSASASQLARAATLRATGTARRVGSVASLLLLLVTPLPGCDGEHKDGPVNFAGDVGHGAVLIQKYGCGNCHDIPDISNARGNVGPPLDRVGSRVYIAGYINNSPENMAHWIEDPQKLLPGNAMPSMGINSRDAHDIAAFLYTLK